MTSGNISVYAGAGSSHSWTWLADLFEANGIHSVRFLAADDFASSLSGECGCAIVSGGDGFGIASALQGEGFGRLKAYISGGGSYVGICAGAYLPLPSSLPPFSEFNLSSTKLENIDCRLDQIDSLPPRVGVRYGSCAVVHPVRGELVLDHNGKAVLAPLYGGPIFAEPQKDEPLLRYTGFTRRTEFQYVREMATSMLTGRPAAVRAKFGSGGLLLFGPHLEHPRYPGSNALFIELLGLKRGVLRPVDPGSSPQPSLSSAMADLKVAILGLENRSFVVGRKMWDGGRYLDLHDAISKRAWSMSARLSEKAADALRAVRASLVRMTVGTESDADVTTQLLVETAREVVDSHFQVLVRSR